MENTQTTEPSTKRVYSVKEIARILDVSERHAYNFCNTTKEFDVMRVGTSIRVKIDSFERWFGK